MQKVTKKMLAMVLAAAMLLGCLAGCRTNDPAKETTKAPTDAAPTQSGTTGETEKETETEPSLFNVGTLPIVNEPVTLKILTIDGADGKASDAGVWAWLEEQTGIHFEVESYSKEDMASKLPLIMATPNEMPDIFFYCNFTDADVAQYGQSGQLLQLDDLIEEYGTNIKELFSEVEEAYGGAVSSDGNIYSLPTVNGKPSTVWYSMNTKFLENSGIEKVPTTLEELYDAMVIMRQSDANGDGIVGNEILWSEVPKLFKRQALSMVGIPCYWPWQGCIFDDKDGEVYFVPTSEEYKYLLTVLHKMYDIGAIDPELFTQTGNEQKDKFYSNLVFMCQYVDDPETADFRGVEGTTWVTPLTSAVHDYPVVIKSADYTVNTSCVAGNTEYPEICMLLLDYLYSMEGSRVSAYGLEGVDYKVVSKDPWVIGKINDDIELGHGPTIASLAKWLRGDLIQNGEQTKLQALKTDLLDEYGIMGWQSYTKLTAEEADQSSVLSADLGKYCDDYFVGFITGNYDIEKDWDAYVKSCESMKVAELTAIYQAAYNRYMGIE